MIYEEFLELPSLCRPWCRYMHTGIKLATVGENQPSDNHFTWLAAFLAVHGCARKGREIGFRNK